APRARTAAARGGCAPGRCRPRAGRIRSCRPRRTGRPFRPTGPYQNNSRNRPGGSRSRPCPPADRPARGSRQAANPWTEPCHKGAQRWLKGPAPHQAPCETRSSRASRDRTAGHRMSRLKLRRLHRGERRVGRRRRAVGWEVFRSFALHQPFAIAESGPAFLVRRDEVDVEAEQLDLPDAVFLDVSVLVDAVAPFGVLLVLAEHAVIAPAGGGRHAVIGDGDRGLKRHPLVELAVDQAFLAAVEALEVFADAILAGIDPIAA